MQLIFTMQMTNDLPPIGGTPEQQQNTIDYILKRCLSEWIELNKNKDVSRMTVEVRDDMGNLRGIVGHSQRGQ